MQRSVKIIGLVLGIMLLTNVSFGWWVFDSAKEAAYQEWLLQQKSTSGEVAAVSQFSGDFFLYTASDLNNVFRELGKTFNAQNPDLNVWQTSDSNAALLKSAENQERPPDILTVSSSVLENSKYFPDECDWFITYSANEMVLLYTANSQFANEINPANWSEVLTREETRYG